MTAEVRVNRKGAGRAESGHPWIFLSDVVNHGDARPGDVVRVLDPSARPLGMAHYSSTSQIRLRLLSRRVEDIGRAFFLDRLQRALAYRQRTVTSTDAYRAVFSEADQLPGLIVDRYGDCLSVQSLSQGMDRALPLITDCLTELLQPRAIVARNDVAVRELESLPLETKWLLGEEAAPVSVELNGLKLEVDLAGGQKTGIYLDQRENYLAAAHWARGRALDCFTSSGGFALHMAARCESVEAVDSSATALAAAERNAKANDVANITCVEANAFDLLSGHAAAGRRFQTIVLDPPAFTKSRAKVDGALRGYREINRRALELIDSGGVLVSCSCSHHVSEAALLEVIAAASLDARRTVRVLERRTQALDHPILLTVPETHYLKCLIFEID